MIDNKQITIANFNCTFGKEDKPMLYYFGDVIFPAFKSGIKFKNKRNGNYYSFEDVSVTIKNGILSLVGLFVKSTYLEVKSKYDIDGKLKKSNDKIPSDPYSYFIINLKNHRMALVKNQKGSPSISELDNAATNIMKSYVRNYNNDVVDNSKKLPMPNLNIVSIPYSGKIKEELKKVKKIEKVTLRFYPLNGDISSNDTFNYFRGLLKDVDSKSGNAQINTPKNHEEVGVLLEETKGLVKPTVKAVYKNGSRRTLRSDSFTQSNTIPLNDESSFDENISTISGKVINDPDYIETSEENQRIYDNHFTRLYNDFYKE